MHLVRSLVDERGQRKSVRLVRADRKATLAQITTLYNHVERKKHLRTLISPPQKREREYCECALTFIHSPDVFIYSE